MCPKMLLCSVTPILIKICIIDTVEYDDPTNTVSFYGMEIFKEPDSPDDVEESNYDFTAGAISNKAW